MKKIWGNFLFYLAKFLDFFLGGLIYLLKKMVEIVENVRRILFFILSLGCIFFFVSPLAAILLIPANGVLFIIIALVLILPLLGSSFANFLEYGKYILCEYLYDKSDEYRLGKNSKNKTFGDYSTKYKREKREEEFRKREKAQREQEEEWRRRFEEFFGQYGRGQYQQGEYDQGSFNSGGFQNPTVEFNKKYEESCKVLGVSLDTDEYEVKLAYRKLAKKYHPDLNPDDPNANEKFNKVNEAYEFLSKENIERYKRINNL